MLFYRDYVHKNKVWSTGILAFAAGVAAWAIFGRKVKEQLDDDGTVRNAYNKVVDEATDKYARLKGISHNEMSDLVDDLKMHWGRIKNAWNEGGDNQ